MMGVLAGWAPPAVQAQLGGPTREYPPLEYYLSFRLVEHGDYVEASRAFRGAARRGVRSTDGVWIDAVCYYAMLGECHYQMGELGIALEQFTSALQVFLANGNWMQRIEFPPALEARPALPRSPITWGTTTRRTIPVQMPPRYRILQGRLDNENVIRQGGIVALPEFHLVNAHEIARCAALAIRRRGDILGRTSAHDPLNDQLLRLLGSRPAPPNHWSQQWIDALLGLTYSVTGRPAEAVTELTKSLQLAAQFDHPLTATALLQLGRLAYSQGQFESAAQFFFEASLAAAQFEQMDLVEESLRWGAATHQQTGPTGMYPPLEPAIAWARRERIPLLEASLLLSEAHLALEMNQTGIANGVLEQARRSLARQEMLRGYAGARLAFLTAFAAYQGGNVAAGDTAWSGVVAFHVNPQRIASHRLFEIGLVDALALSGNVTPRVAQEMYADVLREPTPADWSLNLVETLVVQSTPPLGAYEHWLAVAWEREEYEQCFEIADRIRRLRFQTTLPLGGRLLAFQWLLEAPRETLNEKSLQTRQELLQRYPALLEASRQAATLHGEIAKLSLLPAEGEDPRAYLQKYADFATACQAQDLLIRGLAFRREATHPVAPPAAEWKSLQSRLQPGQAVLAYLLTSQHQLYGFVIRHDGYDHWRLDGANQLGREVAAWLRQIGNQERHTPVDLETVRGADWTAGAASLWPKLTQKSAASLAETRELIVIPDRWLWYVPFEALLTTPESTDPLLTRCQIRYVPLAGWALPDQRPYSTDPDTVVISDRTVNEADTVLVKDAIARLRGAISPVTEFVGKLPVPANLLAVFVRRALVLDDLDPLTHGLADWNPWGGERAKVGNTLSAWLALPWGAPDQLVLPGFHTMAEAALKRTPTGDEIFLPACGLLAAGSRSVLLSRWQVGGQSSLDLSREFVQELPFSSAPSAWQRSVLLLRDQELDLTREPRLKVDESDSSVKGSHPFFWSGYLLIDTGSTPVKEAPAKEPAKPEEKEPAKLPTKEPRRVPDE